MRKRERKGKPSFATRKCQREIVKIRDMSDNDKRWDGNIQYSTQKSQYNRMLKESATTKYQSQ